LQRSRGGFIAEASLESRTYHCDALASERAELLAFSAADFKEALENDATFRKQWQPDRLHCGLNPG